METKVKTYKNMRKMERDVVKMGRAGWAVRDISEHREQSASGTCGVLILTILTLGLALVLLLLARKTIYTVTYVRSTEVL
jgi:hypothetical protein